MSVKHPECRDCESVTSGDCGTHGPMIWHGHLTRGVPPEARAAQAPAEQVSLTEGELTKRLEGVVQRLMSWCDCGGEGCDLCHSAKAVVQAALSIASPSPLSEPQAGEASRPAEEKAEEAYLVKVEINGCGQCGAGRMWFVVGPDGMGLGTSFEVEEDAEELAEALNAAYEAGKAAAPAPLAGEPAPLRERVVRQIAERIARALFTNGQKQRATRLVMADAQGCDLGGWGESVVVDWLESVLRAAAEREGQG